MNKTRSLTVEISVLLVLVALGAGVRIVLGPDYPNFAPVAAISLFAGYFFRRTWLAILAPWLSMTLSDAVLGGYEWQMMFVVYGMLMLPMLWSGWLRHVLRIERSASLAKRLESVGALIGCSLLSSILFFLVTNFAWFPWSDLYPHTWEGLVHSYQQGLPFFRSTLLGDLLFATTLFGSYTLAVSAGWVEAAAPERKLIQA